MKPQDYVRISILLATAFLSALGIKAQDSKTSENQPPQDIKPAVRTDGERPNMFRQLGLTEEQLQQIRRINVERRPLMDQAQKRFREANLALDAAIYADQLNEGEIEIRFKALQLAQSEVAKLRYMNELSVRRVLTQEQLQRFREMRQNFERVRKNLRNRRQFNGDRPKERHQPRNRADVAPDPQQPAQ